MRKPFYENDWNIGKIERHTIYVGNGYNALKGAHFVVNALPELIREYISNIGCDETGVHSKSADAEKMRVDLNKAIPNPKLEKVEVNPEIQRNFKQHYSGGKLSDIKRFFATKYIVFKEKRKKSV